MLQCWSASPEGRPSFTALEKSLGKLLENGVAEHYIDLNEPYLQMNESTNDGQTDYLALMAVPDCPAPPVPTYVNGHIQKETNPFNNLNHATIDIDPREVRANFTSNNLNSSPFRTRRKEPDLPEEIPMLKRNNLSDSETDVQKKDSTDGVPMNDAPQSPVISTNSYVNVPATISPKNSVSNPSYVVVDSIREPITKF